MSSLVGRTVARSLFAGLLISVSPAFVVAGDSAADNTPARQAGVTTRTVLTPDQWQRLDGAVDRGLAFLAKSQAADGAFPTSSIAQPAVTSLCIMAFLSRGHQPGKGPYGAALERAIDYVLDMQNPSSGAIMPVQYIGATVNCGSYSHAISGVMLAEVYGTTNSGRHARIGVAATKALEFTRQQQRLFKDDVDAGGWRYPSRHDSDLSVTSWQLMFYRAARNAEFKVPEDWVRDAMKYVHRLFDMNERSFVYGISHPNHHYFTRGMAAPESSAWPWEANTARKQRGPPASGSCSTRSSPTTIRDTKKIATTTARAIAARRCSSSAASIGTVSFRRS